MKTAIATWFRQMWPDFQKRHAVAGEYLSIGASHRLLLADIGLRGLIWSDLAVRGDHDGTMINLGRRELALEIIELCNIEPERLFALLERAPVQRGLNA